MIRSEERTGKARGAVQETVVVAEDENAASRQEHKPKVSWALGYYFVVTACFAGTLLSLVFHAWEHNIHSHVLLVPLVSAYLIFDKRRILPSLGPPFWSGTVFFGIIGAGLSVLALTVGRPVWSDNDFIAAMTASYLCFVVAGGFLFLGKEWMRQSVFAVSFLVFMIPMPDQVVVALEQWLMVMSAHATQIVFELTGTPFIRSGQVFKLSGMIIEVAQECSGIRSTWVLFITSLLAAYLFLRSWGTRVLFVALVIPLGIMRNAVRIAVVSWLCVERGPHMVDSWIHRQGGPLFFAMSLIPLLLFLGLLWAIERKRRGKGAEPVDFETLPADAGAGRG